MEEPAIPTYYASGISFGTGPFDITVTISGRYGTTPKDVVPIAQVVFSPQHALIVSRLLAREIERYQDLFGKIDLPPRLYNDLGLEP